jgi:hypothetical protein
MRVTLLGLKGTMSEAELYWMRLRLDGAKLNKARRGALYFVPASGWNVPARGIDRAVAALFLDAITPPEIELALAVVREAERQGSEVDRQMDAAVGAGAVRSAAGRTPPQGHRS